MFIERCINLLKPGKRAGIVLPEGVLDNPALERVRKFVESKARILNITSIPSDVFLSSGANIKPSLVFIQKFEKNEDQDDDYLLSVTKVSDAGISSTGLPSSNEQLPVAAMEVHNWISTHDDNANFVFTKIVKKSELINWSVKSIFDCPILSYNPKYPTRKIGELLNFSKNQVELSPDVKYTRLTVKLFNKGIVIRDVVLGSEIGTKRQTMVKSGQFVISKIDGKSAAFGIIGDSLDGSIVTPDFMVYDINRDLIIPEYLELVLQHESILTMFSSSSSGTTGRRRLSQKVFENTRIALPNLDEQNRLISNILHIRESQKILEKQLKCDMDDFNKNIFE